MADPQKPTGLHPERARAVITTEWSGGYKPVVVRSIESFLIDSNMDQDTDNFNLVLGDPYNHLAALSNRDGEVRIQIFGIGLDVDYLLTGLVDDIERTDDGTVALSGRDRSAIAADTQAAAGKWTKRRANEFIEERARELKITDRIDLVNGPVQKTIRQDGTETEWEFWYRLIRKEQMWLWFTSDGRLVSRVIGFNAPPTYYFGTPPTNISASEAKQWVPVESVSYRKSTQTRVGFVELFYKGPDNKQANKRVKDPLLEDWQKRPLKYIEDSRVHTESRAIRTCYEEIFESKVGALEINLTIPDLGFIVRQNRIARVRIPEIDMDDKWFIVGTQIRADANGFVQQVRLREKNYALTRRIPPEPKPPDPPPGGTTKGAAEEEAECLEMKDITCRKEWTQYFVNAARAYQSAVPYELYLAILLAMAIQEGCRNVRQSGDIEWFKWTGEPQHGIKTFAEYRNTFANDAGQSGGGVGPMQLTTQDYKYHADKLFKGKISELDGNRWLPEANIMTAAWVLTAQKGNNQLSENNIWAAVKAYNGSGEMAEGYMNSIKRMVYNNPGLLKQVSKAITACNEEGNLEGTEEVPDDNARKAAERLLEYNKSGWFYLDSDSKSDLQATARGESITNGCGGEKVTLKAAPLNLLEWILGRGYGTGVTCFISGHDCNVNGGGRSRHSDGWAADISDITTAKFDYAERPGKIGNGSAWTRSVIISVMTEIDGLDIDGGSPKQMICSGNGNYDKVIDSLQLNGYGKCESYPCYTEPTRGDHKDHIHVGW